MPETLVDVFGRIRTQEGSVAVPVRPDPGDVRARAGRARARRRLAVAAGTACLLGIGAALVVARSGGGTSVDVVPASPTWAVTGTGAPAPTPFFTPVVPTTPYGPYKDLTPPGRLLDAAELGVGQPGVQWTAVPTPPPDQVDSVGTLECIGSDTSNDGIDGLGHGLDFRASVSGGKLYVQETVLRLDAAQIRKAAGVLRDLAPCAKPRTREVVLSRSADRLLTGTRLAGTGALVSATAMRLDHDQFIVVTVDSDPTDRVPIPGGLSWLRAVTDRAATRAGG